MTPEELTKATQDRQVYLAEIKKQREDYIAQKEASATAAPSAFSTPTPTATAAAGGFNF